MLFGAPRLRAAFAAVKVAQTRAAQIAASAETLFLASFSCHDDLSSCPHPASTAPDDSPPVLLSLQTLPNPLVDNFLLENPRPPRTARHHTRRSRADACPVGPVGPLPSVVAAAAAAAGAGAAPIFVVVADCAILNLRSPLAREL